MLAKDEHGTSTHLCSIAVAANSCMLPCEILKCCCVRYIHTASACAPSRVFVPMQMHDIILMHMSDKRQEKAFVQHALCKQALRVLPTM